MTSLHQEWYTLEHVAGKSATFPFGSRQNPPNLPHVFIYIVFVLENLGDCGFCSQHFIYTRKYFMVEGR